MTKDEDIYVLELEVIRLNVVIKNLNSVIKRLEENLYLASFNARVDAREELSRAHPENNYTHTHTTGES